MRWYVQQNGQTSGPVEGHTVADWAQRGQLGPETLVASEGSSQWLPIKASPFCTLVIRPAPRKAPLGQRLLLAALIGGGMTIATCGAWIALSPRRAVDGPPPAHIETVVHTVPLEVGDGDDREPSFTLGQAYANGSVELKAGTRIERLLDSRDTPEGSGKVRVTSGSHAGEVGFLVLSCIQAAR